MIIRRKIAPPRVLLFLQLQLLFQSAMIGMTHPAASQVAYLSNLL
jgi:hypothetical protein